MAKTPSFDLLVEPWIPLVDRAGCAHELGILKTLARAHEFREIVDPSPLVTFGIHRLLAAVLQRYLPLRDEDDWADVWELGTFAPDLVEKVDCGCRQRMDLFDPDRPFYQSGDIPLTGKPTKEDKTAGYLFPEESTGTNVVHFSHPGDDAHAYCPACCARGLVSLVPFATSGGSGIKPSINGTPPIYVLPEGANLFETLMLNYIMPPFRPKLAADTDPGPLWENGPVASREERTSVGYLESLTWPPRRVRLFPEGVGRCARCSAQTDLLVSSMVFGQGRSRVKGLQSWDDPWVAFHSPPKNSDGESGLQSLRPRPDKGVWRDFPNIFLAESASQLRPSVLRQTDSLLGSGILPTDLRLRFATFLLRTDGKAKVFEWRTDLFDFPPALLSHGTAAAPVADALKLADGADLVLRLAIRRLHPEAERKERGNGKLSLEGDALTARASRSLWQSLELPFRQHITNPLLLGSMAEQQAWVEEWRGVVVAGARTVFEAASDGSDMDSDALRRRQKARRYFFAQIKRLAEPAAQEPLVEGR